MTVIYISIIIYNIIRSMSRIGTPTDNPIIESKNGWLKTECTLTLIKMIMKLLKTI